MRWPPTSPRRGVPMLAVDDSVQIARHAAQLGLLDAAALDDVQDCV